MVVKKRLEVLAQLSFSEVASLPSVTTEEIFVDGKKAKLSVWHDVLNAQEHLVVVQLYQPVVLGIGGMLAEGFVMNARNEKRALTTAEWAPFS